MKKAFVDIVILDTTLRDGAQSLPSSHQFAPGSKVAIAKRIASLGVGAIEAGFPATPSDGEEVMAVAKGVGRANVEVATWQSGKLGRVECVPPVIVGFARATKGDIDATWAAIRYAKRPRINTFISTSDFHRTHKFPGVSRAELLAMGVAAVAYARKVSASHEGSSVQFSAEAASTTNPQYLKQVILAMVAAGASVVNVPDTVGERDPAWMERYYSRVIGWVMEVDPTITIAAHNHNDLGLAAANTLALVRAAARWVRKHNQTIKVQLETTICGLGERAGNADVFAVMGGLFKFGESLPSTVRWQFNPEQAVGVADYVLAQAGFKVPRQSVIVGCDTNVHRSGIHSDGVLKGGHSMYTPFDPTFWGHSARAVHEDGRYQGRAGRAALGVKEELVTRG